MRVLITGNTGYLGSVLSKYLKKNISGVSISGLDTGYFAQSLTGAPVFPEVYINEQIFADARDIDEDLLKRFDAVIHLAAVSNDPMGNEFIKVTEDINRLASVNLAKISALAGVKNFVYASSCSMYGESDGLARKESDQTSPLTAYARSKIGTEQDLACLDLGDMVTTSLRFATACGMSDRLRLDLVLNDFVACAIATGKISVLSDGSPWRPLIDVEDMSRAIHWAIVRPKINGGKFLCINAGASENNYQVKDLAEAVVKAIPGTSFSLNKEAQPDKRSYKVDFSLYHSLVPDEFLPKINLNESIKRLIEGLCRMSFSDANFRNSSLIRLNALRFHLSTGALSSELRWNK